MKAVGAGRRERKLVKTMQKARRRDGSVGNGIVDADGAQARGVKGISVARNVQLVGSNGSMDSGGIAGAGAQLVAAEEVVVPTKKKGKREGARNKMTRNEWEKHQHDHGQG